MKRMHVAALLFILLITGMVSCFKVPEEQPCTFDACAAKAPAEEIQRVKAYIDSMGITATQHCSGLFYRIDSTGTGIAPEACDNVNAAYKGMLTNGSVFDQSTSGIDFSLRNVIRGWTIGVPLIKSGGKITLYLPPSLGYGNNVVGPIPANSILIFDIRLNGVY